MRGSKTLKKLEKMSDYATRQTEMDRAYAAAYESPEVLNWIAGLFPRRAPSV
jgi:hypothetical protein